MQIRGRPPIKQGTRVMKHRRMHSQPQTMMITQLAGNMKPPKRTKIWQATIVEEMGQIQEARRDRMGALLKMTKLHNKRLIKKVTVRTKVEAKKQTVQMGEDLGKP